MEVILDQIVASTQPIRTHWDEDEMQQLTESVKQWGVIQAVKLRPVGDVDQCYIHGYDYYGEDHLDYDEPCHECAKILRNIDTTSAYMDEDRDDQYPVGIMFEIVDGHRRVEASRRADKKVIEATIEGMDDQTALTQSLIANVQREDMNDVDKAHALSKLKQVMGWSIAEMSRMGIMSERNIHLILPLARDSLDIQQLVNPPDREDYPLTSRHVSEIRPIITSEPDKIAILRKARDEQYSHKTTRKVAEAIKAAGDDERAKEALLAEPYSPLMHDPEIVKERAKRFAGTGIPDPMYIKPKDPERTSALREQQSEWDRLPQAQMVIDYIKQWEKLLKDFRSAGDIGKLSPEGRRFVVRRLAEFASRIADWKLSIEEMDNE